MCRSKTELDAFIASQRLSNCFEGLPLQGKRVLDMSTVIAAPYAAALLGDAGAEVLKIENPKAPDGLRSWGTIKENGIEPYYAVIGRNKLPVTVNLKNEHGKALFLDLVKQSDVLIENMRVGVMERLGLTQQELLAVNPGLIIAKVSGYGTSGPNAEQPGFGTLAEAYSGFTYLNGHAESGPTSPPNALADLTTGVHLAFAVSLALANQERGVKGGQLIDISLYEPLLGYLGGEFLHYKLTGENPEPIGNELRAASPRNNYQTKDGKWIALSCSSQKPWEKLAQVMGHDNLIKDPRFLTNNERIEPANRKALNGIIQDWLKNHTKAEALEICRRENITAGPIMAMRDIDVDEHMQQRESFITLEDPATGIALKFPNVPFRLTGQPTRIRFPGLPHGSANDTVYKELLGYNEGQISELKAMGAI
ncbi:CoA transferase [Dasania sp. GY-MA-18]|uniref:CoA transferase n=1 Tax=Dasania phycosphaerae TaxID=2950436 RepID=A0A9J6RH17_9GAMM|nr:MULTISPECIES: CoA transferase [Dasania]MCR8921311.1 CoA transferase [Dasania sp. GY-MA-18]MCZ0863739.1 CoA transferase [Dasania phycosphaerae]MCZ0867467.1 CoA transferase [Dasania phycosphaerae]